MKNMKVAMVELNETDWGDESDPTSNWSLFNMHASFSHRDACEFILYIGEWHIPLIWSELGFTLEILTLMIEAKNKGYNYICFYN